MFCHTHLYCYVYSVDSNDIENHRIFTPSNTCSLLTITQLISTIATCILLTYMIKPKDSHFQQELARADTKQLLVGGLLFAIMIITD